MAFEKVKEVHQLQDIISVYSKEVKEKKQRVEQLKQEIFQEMDESKTNSFSNNGKVFVSRTKYPSKILDIERLKKENPELVEKYTKQRKLWRVNWKKKRV